MKKSYTITAVLFCTILLSFYTTSAQGIYQFWGTTGEGIEGNTGTLFSTKPDGTGHIVRNAFGYEVSGRAASAQTPIAYNSKLYGMLRYGGMNDDGIIYQFDPVTGIYTKLFDLFYINGSHPYGNLVLHNNKMYGLTADGGINDHGIIFEFDPANNTCVKKKDFTDPMASSPYGDLTLFNNKFYGLLRFGGANNAGGLFEWDPATNNLVYKMDFTPANGEYPAGSLVVYNNLLWSTTHQGGVNNKGTLFSYNPATNTYTKKIDLTSASGSSPDKDFVLYNNKFYGLTQSGGANSNGVLFEYDPMSNTYTKKIDLSPATGTYPRGNMSVYNSKLYGTIGSGGTAGKGVLFEYNPANNNYIVKTNLDEATGHYPWGGVYVHNNKMYGLTSDGGVRSGGTLFEYDPASNGYVKKVEFGSLNGKLPEGYLAHYDNKIYGVTSEGGEDYQGVIYQYDLSTHSYTVIKHLTDATGYANSNGSNGLVVHNAKIYGVTNLGGANGTGTLFEVNPANNAFTKLYDFNWNSGQYPRGPLTSFNGKLYGGTSKGGSVNDMGTIFQYEPTTNNLAVKVVMDATKGEAPSSRMIVYNNKLYGTCFEGGANDEGTLFEYDPAPNAYIKKFDFDGAVHGGSIRAGLELMNGKIYGVADGGTNNRGMIFEYVPGTNTVTNLYNFSNTGVRSAYSALLGYNNKLFGLSNMGSSAASRGALYEFDPAGAIVTSKTDLFITNGSRPGVTQLMKIPAVVAPGDSGTCSTTSGLINSTNNNEWVPFTNEYGDAVAEIKANGNNLGRVLIKYYVHDGTTRQDGNGNIYLNRNLSIEVDNQPATPVSIRLYIRKTEFNTLKATPGSGLFTHGQLQIFKNNDACGAAIVNAAFPVPTTPDAWGADYVYVADVSSFSSFYFAKNTVSVLPVTILSFKGTKEATANRLEWKAGCTSDVDFNIERTTNGTTFQSIGTIKAKQADCNGSFSFLDQSPAARSYYRLKMVEPMGKVSYSNIILLDRASTSAFEINLYPNPVVGTHTNLQISISKKTTMQFSIVDANGRTVLQRQVKVDAGTNSLPLPVSNLAAGVYQVHYNSDEKSGTLRFIKQ